MRAKLVSWWQKYKVSIMITAIIVIGALIYIGYQINASGFNGYHTVSVATAHSGTSSVTVTRTEVEVPAKSFWDWMQLLGVPLVLAFGALWFNRATSRNEQEIALDKQREDLLQAYLDRMSELLLDKDLRKSKPDDEVRKIAQARTLTVLPRLNRKRKRSVLQFLYESGLIDKDKCILDLQGANLRKVILWEEAILRGTDLNRVDLADANLWGANLCEADLSFAKMYGADLSYAKLLRASLSGAVLVGAKLFNADLSGADLSGTDLSWAKFRFADLSNANLSGATLSHTNLSNANLSGANLWGVDLSDTNLRGTILDDAELDNVTVTNEQLSTAKSLKGATMPNGTKHS